MLDIIEQAFESLFFGIAMPFGLLILIAIALSIAKIWKYSGILSVVLMIFMAIEYAKKLNEIPEIRFYWGMMICFLTAIFIFIYIALSNDEK